MTRRPRLAPALLALLATAVLYAAPAAAAPAQSPTPARAPMPTERARNCSAGQTGSYSIRNAPSCAARIADGERRYGVRARFVSLPESRQIPGSWLYTAPWGPCAEGESLVFLTPGGAQLFAQTAGQCDERFAGGTPRGETAPPVDTPTPPLRGGTTRSGGTPVNGGATGGGMSGGVSGGPITGVPANPPSYIGQVSEFGCVTPPPTAREAVRGLMGGALCELRENDELYCRQRAAYSRNPYLPTNAAWDMKPVGLRVTRDCRFLAGQGSAPAPVVTAADGPWTRPGQCCVGPDRRAVCPADDRRVLTGSVRLDALRDLGSCPAPRPIDPIVRGIVIPNPAGDAGQWAARLVVGTARCLQLTVAGAEQMARHAQQWRFDLLEQDLGLAREPLPPGVAPIVRPLPVLEHRMLSLMVQAMAVDVMRTRLGAFADDPLTERITDYESGVRAGEHLCGYGLIAGGQRLIEPIVGLTGKAVRGASVRVGRGAVNASRRIGAGTARAAAIVAEAGRRARTLIAAVRDRARRDGRSRLNVRETGEVVEALDDVTRPSAAELNPGTLQDAIERRLLEVEAIRRGALAHTGITLPGERGPVTMNLGEYRGGGSFSAVYDLVDAGGRPTGRVLKLVHETRPIPRSSTSTPPRIDNQGGESVQRQVRGAALLRDAGVDTPDIHRWHVGERPREVSWIETDAVPTGSPTHDTWGGTTFPLADKQTAVVDLHARIGAADVIAIDTAGRNVYFFREAGSGRIRAGMWDTDFIDPVNATVDARYESMRIGALHGELMKDPATASQRVAAFLDLDWSNSVQMMERIRVINYGF